MHERPSKAPVQEILLLDYCPCCQHVANRCSIDLRLAGLVQALGEQHHLFKFELAYQDGVELVAELHICPQCLTEAADGDVYAAAEDHSVAVYRALAK